MSAFEREFEKKYIFLCMQRFGEKEKPQELSQRREFVWFIVMVICSYYFPKKIF